MTKEQEVVLMIKGSIASLPAESQEAINEMAEHVRTMIRIAAPGEGALAVALIGAEMAAE